MVLKNKNILTPNACYCLVPNRLSSLFLSTAVNTGYTQKNVAVSKVNKKFISQLTRAQRTPSHQRQLSKFLMRYQQFASHAYCGASYQDGVATGKGFLCAPFGGVQICDYSAA